MSSALEYPETRYHAAPMVDLSSRDERERLGPPAVRAFFRIMDAWSVRDEEARLLLGGMSNGAYYAMKKQPERVLDEDRLRRVSLIVGIFKALNILYDEALADRWMQLPNRNRLFSGHTPLSFVITGGLPAMATLRRLLDARRGG
ncbi:MAG: antitoxin Xre/MbcA/ParS toxin-binding domain-containing protein [Myxococcota bacterium]